MVVRRILAEWFILLLALVIGAVLIARIELTRPIDARLLDNAASLARTAASDDILIVAIDDASLTQIGPWPWPRDVHSQLVEQLRSAGAGPLLYDVLFLDPTDAAQDAALGESFDRYGEVVLPFTFARQPNTVAGMEPAYSIAAISAGAATQGHVAIRPDPDGVLRRFQFDLEVEGQSYPHFVQSALSLDPRHNSGLPSEPLIAFHPVETYARIPAAEIILGRVPAEFLRGKTILVGATAQGMGDRYSVGARAVDLMPGVETQANLLDAARHGGLVRDTGTWWAALLAIVALLAQFIVFWRLSPRAGLVATFAIAAVALLGSVLLVPLAGLWVPPGAALFVVLLAYPFWSWRRLTSVSAYLEEEAALLRPAGAKKADVDGFDLIARQVQRMHRLVSKVSHSFQFMRQVIGAAPDAILVLDREGRVALANHKARQLFPEWSEDAPEPLIDLLADTLAVEDRERGELVFPDGRIFLVAQANFELDDATESGEIVALRDVTESRRREEQRKEMLEFLSHDMRTPQVAIIGLSRRLQKGETLEEVGPRIRVQAERTLKLADDFVQLARLEEAELEIEEADLVAVIEEACDRAYAAARGKQIIVDPVVPEDPLFAVVDISLIARMLDNLIGNAIKFAPEGSTVGLALENLPGSIARVSVSDEGPGLPPERLANPFARFGAHESRAGPSVGLGLTFVKRVVDKHHGEIIVESGSGTGTRFVIDLPTGEV